MFIGIKSYITAVAYQPTTNDSEIIWIKLITAGNYSVFICPFYRPPGNDINPPIYLHGSLEILYNKVSSSSVIILGSDFNLPVVLWNRGCGYVSTNPVYDQEMNKSLIDIANNYHLEHLVHEKPVKTTSWIFYFVLILPGFLRLLLHLEFQIMRLLLPFQSEILVIQKH